MKYVLHMWQYTYYEYFIPVHYGIDDIIVCSRFSCNMCVGEMYSAVANIHGSQHQTVAITESPTLGARDCTYTFVYWPSIHKCVCSQQSWRSGGIKRMRHNQPDCDEVNSHVCKKLIKTMSLKSVWILIGSFLWCLGKTKSSLELKPCVFLLSWQQPYEFGVIVCIIINNRPLCCVNSQPWFSGYD